MKNKRGIFIPLIIMCIMLGGCSHLFGEEVDSQDTENSKEETQIAVISPETTAPQETGSGVETEETENHDGKWVQYSNYWCGTEQKSGYHVFVYPKENEDYRLLLCELEYTAENENWEVSAIMENAKSIYELPPVRKDNAAIGEFDGIYEYTTVDYTGDGYGDIILTISYIKDKELFYDIRLYAATSEGYEPDYEIMKLLNEKYSHVEEPPGFFLMVDELKEIKRTLGENNEVFNTGIGNDKNPDYFEGNIAQMQMKENHVYSGAVSVGAEQLQYYATREMNTTDMNIVMKDKDSNILQEIIYKDDLIWGKPDIIYYGLKIEDVNNDNNDDIWIDLGMVGQGVQHWACFVYDAEMKEFVPAEGFEELNNPQILHGEIRTFWKDGAAVHAIEKYVIVKDEIILLGRLIQTYVSGGMPDGGDLKHYREEHYENGLLIYEKDNILISEVDMEFWNNNLIDLQP